MKLSLTFTLIWSYQHKLCDSDHRLHFKCALCHLEWKNLGYMLNVQETEVPIAKMTIH